MKKIIKIYIVFATIALIVGAIFFDPFWYFINASSIFLTYRELIIKRKKDYSDNRFFFGHSWQFTFTTLFLTSIFSFTLFGISAIYDCDFTFNAIRIYINFIYALCLTIAGIWYYRHHVKRV